MCVIIPNHQLLQLPILIPNRSKHRLSQASLRHLSKSHEVGPYDRNGSETTQNVYSLSIPVHLDCLDFFKKQYSRTSRLKNSVLHSTDNGVSQTLGRGALREDGKIRGEMGRCPSSLLSPLLITLRSYYGK